MLDMGLGGFRIGDYEGELMPGTEFLVDGLGMTEEVIIAVRIDCAVACRLATSWVLVSSNWIYSPTKLLMP